jgi:ATP/maltotriose-dependent transcriptional regulator MalT
VGVATGFVGRSKETAALWRELARAQSGEPRLVLVCGEPGIGKTRLVSEFADAASSDAHVLVAHCLELSAQAVPLAPVQGLVHRAYRRLGAAELRRAAGVLAPELAAFEPALLEEGAATARPAGDHGDSRLFNAVRHLLEQLSSSRPLLVVIEDLHWADTSTVDLVRYLVATMEDAAVLIVATMRAGTSAARGLRAQAMSSSSTAWLDVGRLRGAEALQLGSGMRRHRVDTTGTVAGDPVDDLGRTTWAVHASQGNPLYLQELVSASHVGVLPPSLQALLTSRLAGLSGPGRHVVDQVSLGDPPVPYTDLLAATQWSETRLDAALDEATALDVLSTDQTEQVSLRHPLLGEAARATMDAGCRRRHHRSWATAYSSARPSSPRLALTVAYHWQEAGEPARALRAALDGAEAAQALDEHATRAALLDRACALWPYADISSTILDLVDILQRAARSHELAGEYRAAGEALDRAVEHCQRNGDASRAASLLAARGRVAFWQGDSMLPFLERALDVLPPDGHDRVRAQVLAEMSDALNEEGYPAAAAQAAEQAMQLSDEDEDPATQAMAITILAHVSQYNDPERAVQLAEAAVEIADRAGAYDVMLQAMSTRLGASDALLREEESALLEQVEEYLRIAHSRGLDGHRLTANLLVIRAYMLLSAGDLDAALDSADRALPAMREHGLQNHCLNVRATVHLIRGEHERARQTLSGLIRATYLAMDTAAIDTQAWLLWLSEGPEAAADLLLRHLDAVADLNETSLVWVSEQVFSLARYLRLSGRAADIDDPGVRVLARAGTILRPLISHDPLPDVVDATLALAHGMDGVGLWRSAAAKGTPWAGVYWCIDILLRLAEITPHRAEALQALADAETEARRLGSTAQLAEAEELRRRIEGQGGPAGLTAREVQVLTLVGDGLSNTDIGRRLFISRSTVGVHISNILAKTGAADRMHAAAWGRDQGLLMSVVDPPAARRPPRRSPTTRTA